MTADLSPAMWRTSATDQLNRSLWPGKPLATGTRCVLISFIHILKLPHAQTERINSGPTSSISGNTPTCITSSEVGVGWLTRSHGSTAVASCCVRKTPRGRAVAQAAINRFKMRRIFVCFVSRCRHDARMPARIVDFTTVQTIAAFRNCAISRKLLGSVATINAHCVSEAVFTFKTLDHQPRFERAPLPYKKSAEAWLTGQRSQWGVGGGGGFSAVFQASRADSRCMGEL